MENSINSDGRLEIKFDTSQLDSDMDTMQKRFESLGLSAIESGRVIQASYGAASAAASAYMEGVSESFGFNMSDFASRLANAKALYYDAESEEKATKERLDNKRRAGENIKKATDEFAKEIYAIEFKAQERMISLMNEGLAKRLAMNLLTYKKEQIDLEEWKQDQVYLYNEIAKTKAINAAGDDNAAAKKAGDDYQPISTFEEIVENNIGESILPQAFIDETIQRSSSINSKLASDNSKLLEEYKHSWTKWARESEQIDKDIASIKKRAAADIKAISKSDMPENDSVVAISNIETSSEATIKVLEDTKQQMTDEWVSLFTDLDAMTNAEIGALIDNLNAEIAKKSIESPDVDISALQNQLKEAQSSIVSNNPFGQLANDVKAYGNATTDAEKKAARAAIGKSVSASAGQAQESLGAVTGLLEVLGVKIPPIISGISGVFGALAGIDFSKPFSIVTGIFKAITSLIGGIFNQSEARIQKQLDCTKKAIASSNKQIEDLQKVIDNSFGYDASSQILKMGDMYKQQLAEIQDAMTLIQEEGKDNKKNKERLQELQDEYDEIQDKQAETKEKAQDAIFGEDLKSAISNFSSAYMDAWSEGELDQDFGKKMVDKMIKGVMKSILDDKLSAKIATLRQMIYDAMIDGDLTDEEYDNINNFANGIQSDGENISSGWARVKEKRAEESLNEVSGKGFEGITQETGGKLDGKFTLMLENQFMINAEIINIKDLISSNISSIVSNLDRIADNTDKLSKLDSIEDNSNYMRKKVDSIITTNGLKIYQDS